jgi:hypothetical protein
MPATKSKPNDYIINEIKIKTLFIENKNSYQPHLRGYDGESPPSVISV